jgi:hypothetical protein
VRVEQRSCSIYWQDQSVASTTSGQTGDASKELAVCCRGLLRRRDFASLVHFMQCASNHTRYSAYACECDTSFEERGKPLFNVGYFCMKRSESERMSLVVIIIGFEKSCLLFA